MSEPLFILSTPRTLTSMSCAMIGNHPEMMGLAETNLLAADTYEELENTIYLVDSRFQHGLLRSVAELAFGEQTEANIELAKSWLEDNEKVSTTELFKDLMALVKPLRIIDTSIIYVYKPGSIERMIKAFPRASFLHMTKHPRLTCDAAYHTRKAATDLHLGRKLITEKALQPDTMWLKPHQMILEALANVPPEQQMFLRGESLLSEPRIHLKQIAEWLGIRSDDKAIDAMMRPEESPFAKYGPENALLGSDPGFLEHPGLKPYKEQPMDLDGPMSWDENLFFDEKLKELARSFGY